jgi:hypothetical protein
MVRTGAVPLGALRQLLARPVAPATEQRCELCGAPLADDHRHVVDARARRLLCACTRCLSARPQPARDGDDDQRLRPVPSRQGHRLSMNIAADQWDALDIPVDLVFFFVNSSAGRPVACYPGPAGATESVLSLDAWQALVAANPWIDALAADVEALLVRRVDDRYVGVLVPIDRCYELAGRIRIAWSGIRGGDEVQRVIERFFAGLAHASGGPS